MEHFAELDSPYGDELLFAHLSAHEAVSEPFTLAITAVSKRADLDYDKLLGEHVTVRMQQHPDVSEEPRYFDGIVEQVTFTGQAGRYFQYLIIARPWFWFLSLTQDCKVYQDKTVIQIIEEVLKDHPIAAIDDRTTTRFTPWVYCVQYRESDFNFLSRLMEQEGIAYYFTHHGGKHVMVLTDSVSGSQACPGCSALPLRYVDTARTAGREAAWDFTTSRRMQPGAAVIQDYDFTRSLVDLRQSRQEPGKHSLGDMEVFDYPGFYDKEGDGEQFVQAQMEEYACAAYQAGGTSDARALACGGLIKLAGSVRDSDNVEYLVLGTQIQVNQPPYESTGETLAAGYSCRFSVLDSSVPYRAPRKTPKPVVQGPQTALVVGPAGDEIYTDKYGRVKVQFHWDRYGKKSDTSSCWVRVSSPWAGKSFGFVQVPRIGQEVVVDFLEGDPDQPIITGRVYNAEQMPPWDLPANATQSGVLSRSSKGGAYGNANALRFEDKKGSEQVWLHAEKNQDIEVENDETHWVGHDRTKTVDHDETTHVKHDRTETVDNNETITIHGFRKEEVDKDETITIHQNRTETVDQNEKITIHGNRTETVDGNETITIHGNRAEKVDGNETIGIDGNRSEKVGGNETIGIDGDRSEKVAGNETIGIDGDRSETVAGNETIGIDGDRSLKVAGDEQVAITGDQTTKISKGRKTEVTNDDLLKVGKNHVIDAGESITLKTGSASITMKKDGTITIKGKDITIQGSGKVNVKASSDVIIKGSKVLQN